LVVADAVAACPVVVGAWVEAGVGLVVADAEVGFAVVDAAG
jgi:hypothetical protein